MRAAWYERNGPALDVIETGTMPDPQPGPGEVLVRVHASGINPSDTKRRAGWLGTVIEYPRIIPHSDGAGIIEAIGEGIEPARIGEAVWLYNGQRGRPFGTCAEYCALPACQAVPLPENADFAGAACLGVPAQTAHYAVTCGDSVRGKSVLVQGGAGAVGHYAIQWAKHFGARVAATVSGELKAQHARSAGADQVINYRADDVRNVLHDFAPKGIDRIIEVDFGANLELDTAVIAENGTIASYSSTENPTPVFPYYPLAYKGVNLHLVQAYILPTNARAAAIADIHAGLAEGWLKGHVAAKFPLEQTAAAHAAAESRTQPGTVVISIA